MVVSKIEKIEKSEDSSMLCLVDSKGEEIDLQNANKEMIAAWEENLTIFMENEESKQFRLEKWAALVQCFVKDELCLWMFEE